MGGGGGNIKRKEEKKGKMWNKKEERENKKLKSKLYGQNQCKKGKKTKYVLVEWTLAYCREEGANNFRGWGKIWSLDRYTCTYTWGDGKEPVFVVGTLFYAFGNILYWWQSAFSSKIYQFSASSLVLCPCIDYWLPVRRPTIQRTAACLSVDLLICYTLSCRLPVCTVDLLYKACRPPAYMYES
jgi:hypothetical protein